MTLKLKRTPGLYIVGFMASGKSTIGRLLASDLGWHFVDIDEEIEKDQGQSISEIFEHYGEAAFRRVEHAIIAKRVRAIEVGKPTVLALGGGTFVQPDNFELLQNNGVSIWLDCSFQRIKSRVEKATHRPLARDLVRLQELYEERLPAYARADFRVEITGDEAAPVVARILKLPIF